MKKTLTELANLHIRVNQMSPCPLTLFLLTFQCLSVRYSIKFLSHTRMREKWRLPDRRGKCLY